VSYSVSGGLSPPPNIAGVGPRAISRIGTRMSGRDPGTWILREPGVGRGTEAESCPACSAREEGTAFIGIVLWWRDEAAAHAAGRSRTGTAAAIRRNLRSFPTPVSTGSGSKGLSQPRHTGRGTPASADIGT